MKKLFQTMSAAILISFTLIAYGAGTPSAAQSVEAADELTSGAPAPTPACGKCGDGYCAKQCGETATSCPRDCGVAY
jgi:uncharacterized low-complexity protein